MNGDISWIVPQKIAAFSAPCGQHSVLSVVQYAQMLQRLGVNVVVQLNEEGYDIEPFESRGIRHVALPFSDGDPPPEDVLNALFDVVSDERAVVAIHWQSRAGPRRDCSSALPGKIFWLHRSRSYWMGESV